MLQEDANIKLKIIAMVGSKIILLKKYDYSA